MNTQLLIPDKIKVGFQEREDTYTGFLGYVIAWDGKKWRKEKSWEGWRTKYVDSEELERKRLDSYNKRLQSIAKYYKISIKEAEKREGKIESYSDWSLRGESSNPEIKVKEIDNIPIEGFVLNKSAGGRAGSWSSRNIRRTVCRIYDPRGFEFEISIENLLYILEYSNSIKGKGLEGKFIYSWSGKDLVLLPEDCPEYKAGLEFTELQSKKVSIRDIKPGYTLLTKQQETVIYLGRFPATVQQYGSWNKELQRYNLKTTKKHWFYQPDIKWGNKFKHVSSVTNIAEIQDTNCHADYADIMSKIEHNSEYSPESDKFEYEKLNEQEYEEYLKQALYSHYGSKYITHCYKKSSDIYLDIFPSRDEHNMLVKDWVEKYPIAKNNIYKKYKLLKNGKRKEF